jgi:hypothetical protein
MDATVATADLNGDGILDVVTDRGAVSLGKGDGTFTQVSDPLYPGTNVELADLNGDGKLDVVLRAAPEYGTGKQSMEVMLGNGDGTFQSPTMFKLPPSNGEHQYDQLRLGDFNGDGKIDIIVGANPTFLLLQD